MNRRRVPRTTRTAIAKAVTRQMKVHDGVLPNAAARQIAAAYDVSIDTVKRIRVQIDRGEDVAAPPEVTAYELSRDDITAIGLFSGNLKLAWQHRHTNGYPHSYRTFVRAFRRLEPLRQIGLREGPHAVAAKSLKATQIVRDRNDVTHFDHTEADIYVSGPGGHPVRPWVTLLIDAATRYLPVVGVTVGDGIGGDPTTDVVVACLAEQMIGREIDGVWYGGIPAVVRYDNALPHLAQAVQNGCQTLGIVSSPIPPASPWRQGKVESVVDTFTTEFLCGLPGYTGGPKDRYGRNTWPKGRILKLSQFEALVGDWVLRYNTERRHSSLDGLTPAEAWQAGTNAIEVVDPDEVLHCFLGDPKPRSVDAAAVRHKGVDYSHPVLNRWTGAQVLIRFLPHRRDLIWVFDLNGELICAAGPRDRLDPEARAEMYRYTQAVTRWTVNVTKRSREAAERKAFEDLVRVGFEDTDLVDPDPDSDQGRDPVEPSLQVGAAEEAEQLARLDRLEARLREQRHKREQADREGQR